MAKYILNGAKMFEVYSNFQHHNNNPKGTVNMDYRQTGRGRGCARPKKETARKALNLGLAFGAIDGAKGGAL